MVCQLKLILSKKIIEIFSFLNWLFTINLQSIYQLLMCGWKLVYHNIVWFSLQAGFITCYLWHELDDSEGYPNFCYGMQHMKIHKISTQPSSSLFGPFLLKSNDFKADERVEESCIWEVLDNSSGYVKVSLPNYLLF
jgi:hypothetical protein